MLERDNHQPEPPRDPPDAAPWNSFAGLFHLALIVLAIGVAGFILWFVYRVLRIIVG